ncbi:hypothetical protein PIB30_073601, partial [Stylosanthes scabra]|nr:hypothetical protein [Stylosanthes scabra]
MDVCYGKNGYLPGHPRYPGLPRYHDCSATGEHSSSPSFSASGVFAISSSPSCDPTKTDRVTSSAQRMDHSLDLTTAKPHTLLVILKHAEAHNSECKDNPSNSISHTGRSFGP